MANRLQAHQKQTRLLARALRARDVYAWLIDCGYFPESYVLPPCFSVVTRPPGCYQHYKTKDLGQVSPSQLVTVHFPKTTLTDRSFGIIDPLIHNDIAFHLAQNWRSVVDSMLPSRSKVVSYSFPLPIDSRQPGRMGILRSGRMIYEFLDMIDTGLAAEAYRYRFLVRADIKNFYPSVYTHSIAWAFNGKRRIRKGRNRFNFQFLGNRLDKLFQCANDGCTNGIPIGPAVSDIIAEVVASAVDVEFTRSVDTRKIDCEAVRFKDDYRILVKSEEHGRHVIKHLQAALKVFNLELSDEKTTICELPDGLFREWASEYHAAHPRFRSRYSWKEFRELYLAVLRIEKNHPGTGVIDRFLADIVTKTQNLRLRVDMFNLQQVMSMLLMMASLRTKTFPKVLAIIEAILQSQFGRSHQTAIVDHLARYLNQLAEDEDRNKYLICWISYFLVSNGLRHHVKLSQKLKDPITRAVWNNRSTVFSGAVGYKLFRGCRAARQHHSLLEYLDVFDPPAIP